ncbi:unnamed protein product [Penicillium salamii]|uniref:Zn(2)-C6 fungal-type domain-containing protein n=1 Tax=Penicillium salamii TaxID=1612424 RepID=A0A9W4NJJ0_9EURO|nr:unnamed protein product [Penicillium salamii]
MENPRRHLGRGTRQEARVDLDQVSSTCHSMPRSICRGLTILGCLLCRARKVKCDERWPTCSNCERLRLECPGHPSQGGFATRIPRNARRDSTLTQAGTTRHRVSKSCYACRVAKSRCSGGDACTRCTRRNLECIYGIDRAKNIQSKPTLETQHEVRGLSNPNDIQGNLHTTKSHLQLPAEITSDSMSWLHSPHLPDKQHIMILVEQYFTHVHPLRCFGFVHKPTFMQRIDEDLESCRNEESLLHIICALGAKFLALDYVSRLSPELILSAGNQWAKVAKSRIFADLDDLNIEKLMTAILLYDHDLRVGSYASAFILSGLTARISQALQLNLESSVDILCDTKSNSPITNESKRRIMWSCYVMDSWVGSGVNQLTLLEDKDLKIQLPCHSHNFSLGTPCITEVLEEGRVLGFISQEQIQFRPAENMGIEAYFIRLVSIRKRVLRYVKHLDTSKPPWDPDSEFQQLKREFVSWKRYLPQNLKWHSGAIWARKESSQLGALTLLWCTYHQTLVDLYRIGMPTLFRIRRIVEFPSEQREFLDDCRRVCFNSAREVSRIIVEASRHGLHALADTWLCIIAHDSTKVMLYYLNHITDSPVALSPSEAEETKVLVNRNLQAIMQMRSLVATAEHCYLSVIKMMTAAGLHPHPAHIFTDDQESPENDEVSSDTQSPIQESPEAVLNPLAIYRMARSALHGKDGRGSASNSPLTSNTTSPGTFQSRGMSRFSNHNPRVQGLQTPSEQDQFQQTSMSRPDRFDTIHAFDNAPPLPRSEDQSLNYEIFSQYPAFGPSGSWDPAEMAVMNMLNDGITPWTAEYLTDGQSGVDPFLFPF